MTQKKAFTIIELMLAMAFIGTMMMGIATLIMQITSIYQKGLSIRSVNSVGREIVSDLNKTINASRVNVDINPSGNSIDLDAIRAARAQYFLDITKDSKQRGGVFCTGSYSYVWNTSENIHIVRDNGGTDNGYISSGIYGTLAKADVFVIKTKDNKYRVPKLARFADKNRDACYSKIPTSSSDKVPVISSGENGTMKADGRTAFNLEAIGINDKDVIELISDSESDLVLYEFTVLPATQNFTTKQIFYPGTFILATYRGGVNILANGDFCQGSSNYDNTIDSEFTKNDFDYCAVNKFNFTGRATGETGINQHGEI